MGKARRRIGNKETTLAADQRRERLESVVKMYLQGKSVLEISKSKGVNRQAIWHDLRTARKIWRKRNDQASEVLIAEEVAKIDRVEAELWEQWERSKRNAVQKTRERGEDGKYIKRSTTTKGQCGDPRYLDLALKCVDKRCRLLKIGEYATLESANILATMVEVVVDTQEEIAEIMDYGDYKKLTTPSLN